MIPTPDLSHLRPGDYEHIYEPAEDTFILLDALEQDAEELTTMGPLISLEIGSGSGCVSSFLGSITGPSAVLYLCTDINPHACKCSSATGRQNKVPLELVNASLAQPLLSRLRKSVDIILFNPPYVPTVRDEASGAQTDRDIGGSWAGGQDGMQVTDRFFPQVDDLLSPRGRFYLVAVSQNNVPDIQRRMREEYALESKVVLQRRAGREHLFVIRFAREGREFISLDRLSEPL
ncbi:S-adenosyl-L-methionine-dependent methyltransferase [Mycena maculata]|uniref:S-adenosyl-L-methionine-dependent methyltransferase n=1 Tax=Mycena maculata TaxID=230809 RepID=A0AAD7J531_9AGAR|nr:S-adenosyl-L-methionine-dependent methyltransferase [Mycena maculata]